MTVNATAEASTGIRVETMAETEELVPVCVSDPAFVDAIVYIVARCRCQFRPVLVHRSY
jgi:hypothetical protein